MAFEEQLAQWREYYLAVAAAAAVLLGLVYVTLSLHLAKRGEPHSAVLGLGAQALLNHGNALFLSLAMLAPFQPPVLPGLAVVAVALNGLINSLNFVRPGRPFRAPVVVPIGLSVALAVGAGLVMARQPVGLYFLAAVAGGLLASAMQYIWWIAVHNRPGEIE